VGVQVAKKEEVHRRRFSPGNVPSVSRRGFGRISSFVLPRRSRAMKPSPPSTVPPAADIDLPPEVLPDLDELVTEDGKPVDNLYVERQYPLLTEPLYASWPGPGDGGPFLAMANVGWFYKVKEPPLVPDAMLILGVTPVASPLEKEGRSYFQW